MPDGIPAHQWGNYEVRPEHRQHGNSALCSKVSPRRRHRSVAAGGRGGLLGASGAVHFRE
jgi:hypothetical protein